MSLTSTGAYEGMPKTRGFSFKGIEILVAGLVLGAAIGFAIANFTSTADAPAASAVVVEPRTVDPHFLEINVGSFDGLAPAESATPADPRFVEINTASLEYPVASAAVVDSHFLEMNVGSLEYSGRSYTEPSNGLR